MCIHHLNSAFKVNVEAFEQLRLIVSAAEPSCVLISAGSMIHEASVFCLPGFLQNFLIIALILTQDSLVVVCCECSFLTDSNKSASVCIHVAQHEMCERCKKILSLCLSFSVIRVKGLCGWWKIENSFYIQVYLKRRTLKMNHKTRLQIFLCKYIKVIVILTGIDRESNGSYALLFSFTSLFTQNWMHFV